MRQAVSKTSEITKRYSRDQKGHYPLTFGIDVEMNLKIIFKLIKTFFTRLISIVYDFMSLVHLAVQSTTTIKIYSSEL